MTRVDLRNREHRRDVLIVLGLFAVGAVLNIALGLVVLWLLQALGWWDVALAAELDLRHANGKIAEP